MEFATKLMDTASAMMDFMVSCVIKNVIAMETILSMKKDAHKTMESVCAMKDIMDINVCLNVNVIQKGHLNDPVM